MKEFRKNQKSDFRHSPFRLILKLKSGDELINSGTFREGGGYTGL